MLISLRVYYYLVKNKYINLKKHSKLSRNLISKTVKKIYIYISKIEKKTANLKKMSGNSKKISRNSKKKKKDQGIVKIVEKFKNLEIL